MTTSTNITLQSYSCPEPKQQEQHLPYLLLWRQGKLLVKPAKESKQTYLPATEDQQWIVECLKRSPAGVVYIDQSIHEIGLKLWADACVQAGKKVFLKIPCNHDLPNKRRLVTWGLKRLLDWFAAALLLLTISPLMLMLALLIRVFSPGPILFRQWRVGERGKLFQIIKFRTMVVDAENLHHQLMGNQRGLHKLQDDPRITLVGRWMRKYSLDELPQLFNVLRGEMSLVGPRPWALYDALRINPKGQKRLNALPGITGLWQVEARSTLLDLDEVNNLDLEYLQNWSLRRDLKILMMTVPKVLHGFGAC